MVLTDPQPDHYQVAPVDLVLPDAIIYAISYNISNGLGKAMEFYRITSESEALFRPLYAMYQKSFPLHEQRLPRHQVEALADPAYHFEAIIENGQLAGLIGYWLTEAFAYIEHFAVSPELRGRALGSGALEEFGRRHSLVILEIDPPEDELSIRRERFYRRLGFQSNDYPHLHPAYRDNFEPPPSGDHDQPPKNIRRGIPRFQSLFG